MIISEFEKAAELLRQYKDLKGDSNYQIFYDGWDWGYIDDGVFQTSGTLKNLILSLEEEIEDYYSNT